MVARQPQQKQKLTKAEVAAISLLGLPPAIYHLKTWHPLNGDALGLTYFTG
jgi:hypothetical protein